MLLQLLERRSQRIKKAAYLTKISFNPPVDDHFSIQVWWADGGSLIKRYYYNDYYSLESGEPRLRSTPCKLARELVSEILQSRGL